MSRRNELPPTDRKEKSSVIVRRVLSLPEIKRASVVLVYMHIRSEVMTSDLIGQVLADGKILTVPYTSTADRQLHAVRITDPDHQLIPGYCNIPEPLPELLDSERFDPASIDAVIVPGSVFDRSGGRLGYGGGYYDRFLATRTPGAARIGLAFEIQLVEQVPVEPHDQSMDFVVTENKIYACRRNRYA